MFDALKNKIDIIQKSVDGDFAKLNSVVGEFAKKHEPHLPNLNTKLEQFKSKLKNKKKKKQNQKNIFEELISVVNKFLEAGRIVNDPTRFESTQKLRQHVIDSAEATMRSAKQIMMDCVKSAFFANGGICGADRYLTTVMDSVDIAPEEIDFLHMFKVPPSSDYGKIMYEDPKKKYGGKAQINVGLYNSFTGTTYTYETPSNKTLFTSTWMPASQQFHIAGLSQSAVTTNGVQVGDFFDDYYSSMEMPDLNEIVKKAMLLTLKAADVSVDKTGVKVGGSFTGMENPLDFAPSLDEAINELERMLNKMFAFCNNNKTGLTPTNLFHDEEEIDEFYFDFDDVEGIDIDAEDARRRKVLKFTDCNNYEVPYNTSHIEDFIYLEGKTDRRGWIDGALNKAASDAYEQSNFSIDLPSFQISINLSFILNIPKSMVMSIISPKMFLPFVIIYKTYVAGAKSLITNAKTIMKILKKIFTCIITEIFWKFIREFWKRVKVDLKNFLKKIILKIIKDKYKRQYKVIMLLISILKKVLESNLDNCASLITIIGAAIDGALTAGGSGIPNSLLALAGELPGFSAVKAAMDAAQKMEEMGIPTGDVNGEPNFHVLSHAATIEGLADNLATTPFMSIQGPTGAIIGALMKN
jgi:hypothetical protein